MNQDLKTLKTTFTQVKTGDHNYIHMRVFRPLPPNQDKLELHSMQENKTESDQLAYF